MRRTHVFSATVVAIGVALGVRDTSAHHSFAPHFDANKPVSIAGTVTEFEARNPHSYLHVNAVDENGQTREYVCESHGATQLARNGIAADMLKAGTRVRVMGSLSRHSPYMCFFDRLEFADGRTVSANGPTGPRTAAVNLPPRKDIFGTWLLAPIPNRSTSGPQPMIQMLTPAGEKAVAAYNPFKDDPTFRCDPVGIRRVWGAPGTPLEIVHDLNGNVVLHHEWMDVRRVVHLDMKEHPKNGPRSSLGHSIGRIEGDTLVIETAQFAEGVLNQYVEQPGQPTRGLLHSAALTTTERLHFDAARQRLIVDIDMTDPVFFKQPFPRATMEYGPSELKIEPFNCSPEGVTGTLRK
jgi:Family of unknown function (DUF6152)